MTDHQDPNFLRLFPLQSIVLFPGMSLPLVVFEPRYHQLTEECIESDECFGVLLLRRGLEVGKGSLDPHLIGTTAHIDDIQRDVDGRLHLRTTGQRRFKVKTFQHDKPYLAADVEYLTNDADEIMDSNLISQAQDQFRSYLRGLIGQRGGYIRDFPLPTDAHTLSYDIAQLFRGDPQAQQVLLELPTCSERLSQEIGLLKSANEILRRQASNQGPGSSFSTN